MRTVFEKFSGYKVMVIIISMGIPISKYGIVEIEGDWVYLYGDGKSGKDYNVAINMNRNNVTEIVKIKTHQL